jgi:hypothetical protein
MKLFGRETSGNLAESSEFHATLGIVYMPQIYDMGQMALKNPTASVGFETAHLGANGKHATPRPPQPLPLGCYSVPPVVFTHSSCHQNFVASKGDIPRDLTVCFLLQFNLMLFHRKVSKCPTFTVLTSLLYYKAKVFKDVLKWTTYTNNFVTQDQWENQEEDGRTSSRGMRYKIGRAHV